MRLWKRTLQIHRDCIATAPLPEGHREIVLQALLALQEKRPKTKFSVVECDLLSRECLFSDYDLSSPWPIRRGAVRYDAAANTLRRVSRNSRDVILLHPEQVVPKWHPYAPAAHVLDEVARELNLSASLADPPTPSQLTSQLRAKRLNPLGLWDPVETNIPDEEQVCRLDCPGCCLAYEQKVSMPRHRTAMTRRKVSGPIRHALRDGTITKATTVLDYGCGKGEDVA
jgi:hypothetical protein